MSLYITEKNNMGDESLSHNPNVEYICQCQRCGNYGTRNAHGRDDECPYCGAELDWSKEIAW